jgi:hypothetical protein
MSNGLKLKEWQIEISKHRYQALINHFVRTLFGNSAVNKEVKEYSKEEYLSVLNKFLYINKTATLQDSIESKIDLYDWESDILLSFIKLHILEFLSETEGVSLKDYLANHLVITGLFRGKGAV